MTSMPAPRRPIALPQLDTSVPHPARRYNWWLGGKDNFKADRESGDRIAAAFSSVRTAAIENRYFLRRVVSYLAGEAGIGQFLDIGTGLPASPNVHEIAQAIAPAARVVYADNDPMVATHARARMASRAEGATAYVEADLRNPELILTSPELAILDLTRPVALLLVAVLHFLDDDDQPYAAVARLVEALSPGSYLVLSHVSFELLPADVRQRLAFETDPDAGHGAFRSRSRDEIAAFLGPLEPVEPGLVPIVQWRPHLQPQPQASIEDTAVYGAVARLP